MAGIESREELDAWNGAVDRFCPTRRDQGVANHDLALAAHRAGWLAGRDWARQQDDVAMAQAHEVNRGDRMTGCLHMPACASVSQCVERESLEGKPD